MPSNPSNRAQLSSYQIKLFEREKNACNQEVKKQHQRRSNNHAIQNLYKIDFDAGV